MTTDWKRLAQRVETPATVANAWEWGLAMPYRCLADPAGAPVMPASPDSIPDEYENWERRHRQQLAYYTTLQSFLTYSFGWTRHDKGLLWCYENGWPNDDPRLTLIKDIWFDDGTLTGYLAWVIARMEAQPQDTLIALGPWASHPDLDHVIVPREWTEMLRAARSVALWTGGSDPMHLWGGLHAGAPSGRQLFGESDRPPTLARIVDASPGRRSATFVADDLDGWYAQLATMGSALPQLRGGASWNVDVFVKPIGFVGTYRRSRSTGLWFAGRHRYHIVGN